MLRPAKGSHLHLRRRAGREPCWTIRNGSHEIGTGCARGERGIAEERLQETKVRKTLLAIAAAAGLMPGVMTGTPGVTAPRFDQAQAHDFQLQLKAEFRAMGECLAGQVRTRGWVGHGPKDRINALYNEYAETCYDKIKPTAFDDPDHPDDSRAMYTYTGA